MMLRRGKEPGTVMIDKPQRLAAAWLRVSFVGLRPRFQLLQGVEQRVMGRGFTPPQRELTLEL